MTKKEGSGTKKKAGRDDKKAGHGMTIKLGTG
jgi:hypothetical protein